MVFVVAQKVNKNVPKKERGKQGKGRICGFQQGFCLSVHS
jgi:hypothetical protein